MKLSTRGRYGLRALADLAVHQDGSPITLAEIAMRQNVSEGYLESIFALLRKAGIVRSVKGAGGGYLLARPAADIDVGEVLEALEGDMAIVEPELDQDDGVYTLSRCIRENVWDVVSERIKAVAQSASLEQLIQNAEPDIISAEGCRS